MTSQVEQVSGQLDAAFDRTGSTADLRTLTQPLLQLLTAGQPVTAEQLAAATDRSTEQVHATLPNLPSIELDAQARVIGMGITVNPTPHRFDVDGTRLYTWCALTPSSSRPCSAAPRTSPPPATAQEKPSG